LPPSSEFVTCFMLIPSLAYCSTLKKEANYSSETLVIIQRTTRNYNPECEILYFKQARTFNYSWKLFILALALNFASIYPFIPSWKVSDYKSSASVACINKRAIRKVIYV
jgi:hypothetical protein